MGLAVSDVAVVIVSHNGEGCIRGALDSITGERSVRQVIVVDNASEDRTREIVRAVPGAKLVENERNVGFGMGHARCLERLQDEVRFLFLLNQDARVLPGAIDGLRDAALGLPAYAVLSPLHLEAPGGPLDGPFAQFGLRDKQRFLTADSLHGALKRVYEVSFVPAAAWLVRRDVFVALGGFSRAFQQYGEDMQFCQRVAMAGLKVGVCPKSEVVHLRASDQDESARRLSERRRRRGGAILEVMNPARSLARAVLSLAVRSCGEVLSQLLARRISAAVDTGWSLLAVLTRLPRLAGFRSRELELVLECRAKQQDRQRTGQPQDLDRRPPHLPDR